MAERTAGSLIQLQNSASTARVLNLHKVWVGHGGAGRIAQPMFTHPLLDRCLIIKHRLRRHEVDLFPGPRTSATKLVLPIDAQDLKLGGHSLFIGQTSYVRALEQAFGTGFDRTDDFATLEMLDGLPSLDPFLLREHLRRHGRSPNPCYFDMSDADLTRMFAFARKDIVQLATLSFGPAGASESQISRLVQKILTGAADTDMEPLRLTLKLAPEEYAEGMFCWRGFLYYKWSLSDILPTVSPVLAEIDRLRPLGTLHAEQQAGLARSRAAIRRAVQRACGVIAATLNVYDEAYAKLVRDGRPTAFREFLIDAPELFASLGERLGAISHVASFWRYQYPAGARSRVSYEELTDVLADFEASLAFCDPSAGAAVAA